jgi:hypothetical protein
MDTKIPSGAGSIGWPGQYSILPKRISDIIAMYIAKATKWHFCSVLAA